jgi:CRISPR/Cas system-associated endoribonuclease Cas2
MDFCLTFMLGHGCHERFNHLCVCDDVPACLGVATARRGSPIARHATPYSHRESCHIIIINIIAGPQLMSQIRRLGLISADRVVPLHLNRLQCSVYDTFAPVASKLSVTTRHRRGLFTNSAAVRISNVANRLLRETRAILSLHC